MHDTRPVDAQDRPLRRLLPQTMAAMTARAYGCGCRLEPSTGSCQCDSKLKLERGPSLAMGLLLSYTQAVPGLEESGNEVSPRASDIGMFARSEKGAMRRAGGNFV